VEYEDFLHLAGDFVSGFSRINIDCFVDSTLSLVDSSLGLPKLALGLNANVSIKQPSGELVCGSIRWINSEFMELVSEVCLSPTTPVELRVELKGWSETVYVQAAVSRTRPTGESGISRAILRIIDMSDYDRSLLYVWLKDHDAGGTSVDPSAIVAKSDRGRLSVRRGILRALK
jgi:hypothetical protein